ncbi:MAG: hypothetical protein WCC53_01520 [Thermoanaerobaculia bacterium]
MDEESVTLDGDTKAVAAREPGRLRILAFLRDQHAHVRPVETAMGDLAEFIIDESWNPSIVEQTEPDLVLCVNDWPDEIAACLDSARRARIPSLVLQDGILEWRCQYENPLFGAGGGAPQHQPVLADKIACLGVQSARHIASWGNGDKVEVTGMPRLDHLIGRAFPSTRKPGNRLLVMTAKNPGFTPDQRAVTLQSLRDVKTALDEHNGLEVTWRIGRDLAETLGVPNEFRTVASEELSAILERADAAITTPSTALLEAMLTGRPVAALDYHNVPRFVATAWTISSAEQIAPVLAQLLDPSPRKMAFQEMCLRDSLECDGPAALRVARLMREMIAAADRIPAGAPWGLPQNLLGVERPAMPIAQPTLGDLYPGQPVFAERDVRELQVRLARAQRENERLRDVLRERHLVSGVKEFGRHLVKALRERRSGKP